MGPQAEVPHPAVTPGKENIAGHHPAAPVHRQVAERRQDRRRVIGQRLHRGDGIRDQQPPLSPAIVGGVVVVGLGLGHPDVDRHHIAVGELVVGVVEVILLHRAVVAIGGVVIPIAEIDNLRLRDRPHRVAEINQQGQPQLLTRRRRRRRRRLRAVLRCRQVSQTPLALQIVPALGNSHRLIPARITFQRLLPGRLGIDPDMLLPARRRRSALANYHTSRNKLPAVGRQLRVIVRLSLRIEHDRVAVQRLKHGIEFVPLAPERNLGPIRLRERHLARKGRPQRRVTQY